MFVSSSSPVESLVGEPLCVAMYRSRQDSSKVGAHTTADVARNTLFGPWLDDDEEERRERARASGAEEGDVTSSRWMRVSLRGARVRIQRARMMRLKLRDGTFIIV